MAVILCYGDSKTHGTTPLEKLGAFARHAPGDRWPDVMSKALGPAHQVISEGLPGRTTVHDDIVEGGMRNGLTVLPAILQSHAPIDLMVLMLGTNDLKHRFSVTAFEISRSLERMVLATRAEGVVKDILLVSPVPVREAGVLKDVFAGAGDRQHGLTAFIAAAAARQGVGFFDAGSVVTVSPDDGVHWDAAAHHAMGAAMAQAVAARL
ncbi:hydrolase GDSL [Marivita cryptomonadis]|uniref:GDSL-type esterase/lipase family protein n=1 Tax=Marivita cryptomonadis TaxID=505252 RepID=UPI000A1E7826|nr:GDSL-type esterase/lipase family protein [Marivita cryptomonadis]OSQ58555.1 hydrolase GDSL [Marivita cryptomonadis]